MATLAGAWELESREGGVRCPVPLWLDSARSVEGCHPLSPHFQQEDSRQGLGSLASPRRPPSCQAGSPLAPTGARWGSRLDPVACPGP